MSEEEYDLEYPLDRLRKRFDEVDSEYLKFEKIEKKLSSRPDIHAFILLNELVPGTRDMVSAAEHDVIYLAVDVEELEKAITDDQVLQLKRCGVLVDTEADGLSMFV